MLYFSCSFRCMLLPQDRSDRTCINCFHNSLCAKYPGILFSVFLIFTRKESITFRSIGKTICTTKTHLNTIKMNKNLNISKALITEGKSFIQLSGYPLIQNMKSNYIKFILITFIQYNSFFVLKYSRHPILPNNSYPEQQVHFSSPFHSQRLMTTICNPFLFMPNM